MLKRLYTGDNKLKLLDQNYLPRWIVVMIDTVLSLLSLLLVYFLLLNTPLRYYDVVSVPAQGGILLGISILSFFAFKTYSGIIRHSTFTDIIKLVLASFSTGVVVFGTNVIYALIKGTQIFLNTSILLYLLLSFTSMLLFRILVKELYQLLTGLSTAKEKKDVVIIGIDDNTIALGSAIGKEAELPFKLIGFLSEKIPGKRFKIAGKPLIPVQDSLIETLSKLDIEGVIMSNRLGKKLQDEIVDAALQLKIQVFSIPAIAEWKDRSDIKNIIKPVQIEDLLERDVISLESYTIEKHHTGKTILVTGGAGSIGSEIVRQIARFKPGKVIILDQAETALHSLELQLINDFPELDFITKLADVSNMYRIELLFKKYSFDVVYHAAAYKHVPIIERNPHEAIYVNILGTVNLAILAISYSVENFVLISTDKAVNPTNVMGASKRAAEMYVQSLQYEKDISTKFTTTRFGNVLGSSGSVIPYFKKQIAEGGPVTVTHKNIIRYFMTIPEACQLVLQASTMGKGGEIYVFDMGKPKKILDVAEKMIRLSGFEPYKDIDIIITGLRPGEKLYEELLNDSSKVQPTHHPKIMIAKVPTLDFTEIKTKIKQIIKMATKTDDREVVRLLKELVPEYKSKNSEFELLDKDPTSDS